VSGLFEWHFTWASFFLIPADLNNSYWIPYWTLCYEMVFYLLLSIGAAIGASARALALACGVWVVAIVAAQFGPKFSQFEPRGLILLSSLNLYFIAGLLLGLYGSVVKQLQSWKGLAGLLIVLSTLLLVQGRWIVLDDFLGACCCAAVVALAVRYLHVRWLEKIGNISFGIYLVHIQLIVMTTRVLTMHFPFTRLSVIWLTAAVVAVGGSTLFGWIELNLHAWLKRPVRPRGAGHGPGATKLS
jgi:exopolysaccharide production protein ExoZ